jgi:hypothetical protein
MPEYQNRAVLIFEAEHSEEAMDIEDKVVTALNQRGRQLPCKASLMVAGPPHELPQPGYALVVSIAAGMALVAWIDSHAVDVPVQLTLRNRTLGAKQGSRLAAFDSRGNAVQAPQSVFYGRKLALLATVNDLSNAVVLAVAGGLPQVNLAGSVINV